MKTHTKKPNSILSKILGFCLLISCSDNYLVHETRIIDSDQVMPLAFYCYAEQGQEYDTWAPVYNYRILRVEPNEFTDAEIYFHAYITLNDSVLYEGVHNVLHSVEKLVYGEFRQNVNFPPHYAHQVTPLAMISVEYPREGN